MRGDYSTKDKPFWPNLSVRMVTYGSCSDVFQRGRQGQRAARGGRPRHGRQATKARGQAVARRAGRRGARLGLGSGRPPCSSVGGARGEGRRGWCKRNGGTKWLPGRWRSVRGGAHHAQSIEQRPKGRGRAGEAKRAANVGSSKNFP